jgi:hypothetical protein
VDHALCTKRKLPTTKNNFISKDKARTFLRGQFYYCPHMPDKIIQEVQNIRDHDCGNRKSGLPYSKL